ncbi:hypothetical protein GE09DRAFT_1123988 [Coniochaeta sp. 2T2.1]|nr:hypothetical protein GE09DRAFT_1123988 [Coniochaeta sp. 2T2.1]
MVWLLGCVLQASHCRCFWKPDLRTLASVWPHRRGLTHVNHALPTFLLLFLPSVNPETLQVDVVLPALCSP